MLLATSGTTGRPRWVALSHGNVLSSITGSVQANGYAPEDVSLNWLPLHHVGGLLRSLREVRLGGLQQVLQEADAEAAAREAIAALRHSLLGLAAEVGPPATRR